jgi:hypothetical protein
VCLCVGVCVCVSPLLSICVCVSEYLPIVARQWLGKCPFVVIRLGKIPLFFARQRCDKNAPIVARQLLRRNVTAVTNTHATIEELLDASFSMWPVSHQGK